MRPTYAEIDLAAVRHNVTALSSLIAPSEMCAVVKADGYGHGDVPVALAAIDAGATRVAVALVEEGVRLREGGVQAPILVLSEADRTSVADIVDWDLTAMVYSLGAIEALGELKTKVKAHLKIDTGMHRVGASPRLIHDLLRAADNAGTISIEGLCTHFPVADEDLEFTRHQIEVFDHVTRGLDLPLIHMANTAGAILFPEARRDMCRIGLGIYGLHPCFETRALVDLRPAMRIVSHVSHVQHLEAGARPSYGRVKPLGRDSMVVTVPIGYADGFARRLTEHGCVLIGGHRYSLAGMVTMDQVVVDVGDAGVHIGDEVVLLGSQGDEEVTADEWAEILETISYEVVCHIGPRVPRRYLD